MPVLINKDDHVRFSEPDSHMLTALRESVSWGYFDPDKNDCMDGAQCPPVKLVHQPHLKKQFFATYEVVAECW